MGLVVWAKMHSEAIYCFKLLLFIQVHGIMSQLKKLEKDAKIKLEEFELNKTIKLKTKNNTYWLLENWKSVYEHRKKFKKKQKIDNLLKIQSRIIK